MAKTYQNLLSEAREFLQDEDENDPRFSDMKLLNALNRGLQELGRLRPDAFYNLYDANSLNVPLITSAETPAADETAWTSNFGLNMHYYTPLVNYVVASIELTEDEFTLEGRAIALLQAFRNSVIGV